MTETPETPPPPQEVFSRAHIDALIKDRLLNQGRFEWSMASVQEVWSALQQSDRVMVIGYKPANLGPDLSKSIQNIDIESSAWKQARQQLVQLVWESERQANAALQLENLFAYKEDRLPIVYLLVSREETVAWLRQSPLVRYAEPMGYHPQNTGLFEISDPVALHSSSGCGSNNAEPGLVEPADYVTIAPGARQSWNYGFHQIPAAWGRGSGAGRKIMVIDTGLSPGQSLFSTLLNAGFSTGRTVERLVTLRRPGFLGFGFGAVESNPDDGCGHGTSMAGVAVSPRNSSGGMVGVAYNANLVSVRATVDVLIDESRESKGVIDALVLAGDRADIQIVSMSIGSITSNSGIRDAVNYAHNRGKLLLAAAGTSFGWSAGWFRVVFPASLPNVRAVTGIKDNGARCDACHQGREVDFVVVMERANNGRKPLSTAQSGLEPSTVGGSSVATATTAGIAALVWSANPGLSRDQLVSRLIQSSSMFPSRHPNFGWGIINANDAAQ